MKVFAKDLGELVKASLENRKPVVTGEKPSVNKLISFGNVNHMVYFILTSALNAWEWDENEAAALKTGVMRSMYTTAVQICEQKRLETVLEAGGVKFLMMKGAIIRSMFPRVEQREMGDIDLLIYPECFSDAERVLLENKYTVIEDIKQHKIFRSPSGVVVEAHHTLCDRVTDKNMYEYFLDYSRHELKEGTKYTYRMTNEDFYIYLLAHMARHFYVKGCGVRNLIDIYIYNNVMAGKLDRQYIEAELAKIGILDFTIQMEKLSKVWLENEESSEILDNTLEYMLEGGSYGFDYNGIWSRFAKLDLEDYSRKALKRCYYFPPLAYMSEKYPELEEHAWLLPFFWIRRGWETIFTSKKQRGKKEERRHHVDDVDDATIKKMSEIYKNMNFNFSSH